MLILMKVTVYKEMYSRGQIIECYGKYGRVMYHDTRTHFVHILFKINEYTWKIEKHDELFCRPGHVFLWTIETAFKTKFISGTRTPQFRPVRVSDDYIMEL